MSMRIKGHDYQRGVDLELTGAEWRTLLGKVTYTRRIGTGVLAFQRRDGRSTLAFEVYDCDGTVNLRSAGVRK